MFRLARKYFPATLTHFPSAPLILYVHCFPLLSFPLGGTQHSSEVIALLLAFSQLGQTGVSRAQFLQSCAEHGVGFVSDNRK